MRFGLNTFLVSSGFTGADLPLIETFEKCGAQLVELAIVEPTSVSVPELKVALAASRLEEPVICGAFGPGRDLRGSSFEIANATHYVSELIEMANALGAKIVCGPMYSRTGRSGAHTAEERESQLEQIASGLQKLCRKAEAAGIILALEPLNRFETDCINTLEQAVEMIDRVGSDALKIHIDTFHMNIEEVDSGVAIRKYAEHIGHVHASASHRGLLGKDQVDWTGVLGALHDVGYEGDIVIESFSEDNQVIAKAASIWRTLYDSPEQMAVEGLQFLKKSWQQIEQNKEQTI